MECRPGEGAPSGSFFLIKDGIGADCGGRTLAPNSVCKVSSIPCHRPPQPPGPAVASLCLLFHLISRVHVGVRSCPPDAAFNAIPSCVEGTALCESPPALAGERKHTWTHSFSLPELRRRTAFCLLYSKWKGIVQGMSEQLSVRSFLG